MAVIASARPGVALALECGQPGLRRQGGGIEDGMLVAELAMDQLLPRLPQGIERQEQREVRADCLQPVHPIGDRDPALARMVALAQVVPARPYPSALRHEGEVAMEIAVVSLIAEAAEHALLLGAGVLEQPERLVGMGRQHHLVEGLPTPIRQMHGCAEIVPAYRHDRIAGLYAPG